MRTYRKKNENRGKILLAIFVIVVMVSSTIGFILDFSLSPQEDEPAPLLYGDYEFTQTPQGLLQTTINDVYVPFFSFPSTVLYIPFPDDAEQALRGASRIKVTYDHNETNVESFGLVQFFFAESVPAVLGTPVDRGLINASEVELPSITCADATEEEPVLYFRNGEDIQIFLEDNCVIAEGIDPASIAQLHDRILYVLFGVVNSES